MLFWGQVPIEKVECQWELHPRAKTWTTGSCQYYGALASKTCQAPAYSRCQLHFWASSKNYLAGFTPSHALKAPTPSSNQDNRLSGLLSCYFQGGSQQHKLISCSSSGQKSRHGFNTWNSPWDCTHQKSQETLNPGLSQLLDVCPLPLRPGAASHLLSSPCCSSYFGKKVKSSQVPCTRTLMHTLKIP